MSGTCNIQDCDRPILAKKLCMLHYGRVRLTGNAGPANLTIAARGEPAAWLMEVAVRFQGADCLKFPFSKAYGYGQVWIDGVKHGAHRWVCEAVHGKPSSPDLDAAHECGVKACVNPHHLSWKSPVDNEADKKRHGTYYSRWRPKLSPETVRLIRAAIGTHEMIAADFGVSRRLVGMVRAREIWAWVDDGGSQ